MKKIDWKPSEIVLPQDIKKSLAKQARQIAYEKVTEIDHAVIQWTYEWFPKEFENVQ